MPGRPRLDIASLRELVRQRVEETSLREVAEETGISKSGIDSFLKGREPYSKTRLKLANWGMRQRHPESRPVPREEVEAALAVIQQYVQAVGSRAVREKRLREVLTRVAQVE
jgi:AcrR family transcriptional regulator